MIIKIQPEGKQEPRTIDIETRIFTTGLGKKFRLKEIPPIKVGECLRYHIEDRNAPEQTIWRIKSFEIVPDKEEPDWEVLDRRCERAMSYLDQKWKFSSKDLVKSALESKGIPRYEGNTIVIRRNGKTEVYMLAFSVED